MTGNTLQMLGAASSAASLIPSPLSPFLLAGGALFNIAGGVMSNNEAKEEAEKQNALNARRANDMSFYSKFNNGSTLGTQQFSLFALGKEEFELIPGTGTHKTGANIFKPQLNGFVEPGEVVTESGLVFSKQLGFADAANSILKTGTDLPPTVNLTDLQKAQAEILKNKTNLAAISNQQALKREQVITTEPKENTNKFSMSDVGNYFKGNFSELDETKMRNVTAFADNIFALSSRLPKTQQPGYITPVMLDTNINTKPATDAVSESGAQYRNFLSTSIADPTMRGSLMNLSYVNEAKEKANVQYQAALKSKELESQNVSASNEANRLNTGLYNQFLADEKIRKTQQLATYSAALANAGEKVLLKENEKNQVKMFASLNPATLDNIITSGGIKSLLLDKSFGKSLVGLITIPEKRASAIDYLKNTLGYTDKDFE